MYLDITSRVSIRDQWAYQQAIRGVQEEWNKAVLQIPSLDESKLLRGHKLPPAPSAPSKSTPSAPSEEKVNVGIIGAGAAGLFTGLILDYLNQQLAKKGVSLVFSYDILEAGGKDRLGGRLYTYNFGGPEETHDYYDVGAMRFPSNPVMNRTFQLFKWLGMQKKDPRTKPPPPPGSLIPYYMRNAASSGREPWCYNDINHWGTYADINAASTNKDPFEMATDGSIPLDIRQYSPDDVMKNAIEALGQSSRRTSASLHQVMQAGTYSCSTIPTVLGNISALSLLSRSSLTPKFHHRHTITIQLSGWKLSMDWYDQALSETVLESLDFEFDADVKWYCVLGGAQQLAIKMASKLVTQPTYNTRATKIVAQGPLDVDVQTTSETRNYHVVLNSTSLGCMGQMDLRDAGLSYAQKQAIRSLGYGPSAKVGIKFKRAWWIHDLGDNCIKRGGLGHSDLNIRTCVYPSYNLYDPNTSTAVLLCSYTWQQDAERLGALMSENPDSECKLNEEARLLELLLQDLVRLHTDPNMSEQQVKDLDTLIRSNYITHFSFDWYKDPLAVGAFAFFRPQQFSCMWGKLIQPAGDVVIIGEAASPHHAWVVGALESAVHGLHAWMAENYGQVQGLEDAMKILEEAKDDVPFVGLPPYMDANMSKWQGLVAMHNRQQNLSRLQARTGGKIQIPSSSLVAQISAAMKI